MSLPTFHTQDRILSMMQTSWASQLNPALECPLLLGRLVQNVEVVAGANVINHLLGRKLQGYLVVLNSANQTYWDSQATNQMPDKTLVLNSSGTSTLTLWVF